MEGKGIINTCTVGHMEHHWWMVPCSGRGLATDETAGTTGACYTLGWGEDGCYVQCIYHYVYKGCYSYFCGLWSGLKVMVKMQLFLSNLTDESQNRKTPEGRAHTHWNCTECETTITHPYGVSFALDLTYSHTHHNPNMPKIHPRTHAPAQGNTNTTPHTHTVTHAQVHISCYGECYWKIENWWTIENPFWSSHMSNVRLEQG